MTELTRLTIDYDDLRAAYINALLTWEGMLLDGEHEAADVVRVRVVRLRGEAEAMKQTLAACGVEV